MSSHVHEYIPVRENGRSREDIVEEYFHLGFSYLEIVTFLHCYHDYPIGLRQLKRILRSRNLHRRGRKHDLTRVIDCIESELRGVGRDYGYRAMHRKLVQSHRIVTDRETVRRVLSSVDPDGVQLRRRRRLSRRTYYCRGPNHVWHIDGWDKLKPYGLCVHGCIDGFSRRILWLEVASTNNNPYVICKYYSRTVREVGGLPEIVRADRGTENVNVEVMQRFLRSGNGDTRPTENGQTFLYGRSTANQRIECWWSKFGSMGMSTWIDHFKILESRGIIDTSSETDIQCVKYCYTELLRRELQSIRTLWNTHYIRRCRNENSPHGKPDILFFMPELVGGLNCVRNLCMDECNALDELLTMNAPDCDQQLRQIFDLIRDESDIGMPNSLDEADELFVHLVDKIELLCNQM